MKNLDKVRESIIEAAEKYFSVLGFEKTTLDNITSDNGRTKTSVYYHFRNKHEIFKSVIEKEFATVRAGLEPLTDLRAYLRVRLEAIQRQGAYRRYATSRFYYGDNPVSRAVKEARSSFDEWEENHILAYVVQGIKDGAVSDKVSPKLFASTMVSILKAMEAEFFNSEDKDSVLRTYEGISELMIR